MNSSSSTVSFAYASSSATCNHQHHPQAGTSARFELQATFALNQLAISMMQKSCFEHAYFTMKSAVATLQIVTDRPDCVDGQTIVHQKLKAGLELGASLQHMMMMMDQTGSSSQQSICAAYQALFPHPSIHIVNHDALDMFATSAALASFSSSSPHNGKSATTQTTTQNTTTTSKGETPPYVLIRIDENDESLYNLHCLNLLTAVILHNFAVSILLLNHFPSFPGSSVNISSILSSTGENCFRKVDDSDAIVILHLAYKLMQEEAAKQEFFATSDQASVDHYNNNNNNNNQVMTAASTSTSTYYFSSFSSFPCVTYMSVILLQMLQKSFTLVGQNDHAFACVMELTQLRALASVLKDTEDTASSTSPHSSRPHRAAAAA